MTKNPVRLLIEIDKAIQTWRETGKPDYARFLAIQEQVQTLLKAKM